MALSLNSNENANISDKIKIYFDPATNSLVYQKSRCMCLLLCRNECTIRISTKYYRVVCLLRNECTMYVGVYYVLLAFIRFEMSLKSIFYSNF